MINHRDFRSPRALAPASAQMLSRPNAWKGALCAALIVIPALLQAGTACAAEAVVVASSAPDYSLGQLVSDEIPVTLPEGASALFLFATGRTVEVRGPYTGMLKPLPEPSAAAGASNLFSSDRFVQSDLGAARAFGNPLNKAAEQAAVIDPVQADTVCVRAGESLTLRRPDDPALSRLRFRDEANGTEATVAWTDGKPLTLWPSSLPTRSGAEIVVSSIPDGRIQHRLHLRTLEHAASPAALAVALASSGCKQQAASVLDAVRDLLAPLDLYLATDQGSVATYSRGEEVRLVLQVNRDSHVYCFLRNARGQLIPIFPSAVSRTSRVEGGVLLTIPGERMPMPVRTGDEIEVNCFAASRDLGNAAGIAADAFRPMSDAMAAELDRALSPTPDKEVAMAQVILRVR